MRASGGDFGEGNGINEETAFTLNATDRHAVARCYQNPSKNQGGIAICAPIAPPIGASGPPYSRTGNERTEVEALVCQPTIMKQREEKLGGGKGPLFGDKSFTLAYGQDQTLFWHGVRRLTPIEAERLQGFQDGYTDIEFLGKPAADGVRYKALGNSMCVNVMRWIGERIQKVENGEL